jgi:hypothetical protein
MEWTNKAWMVAMAGLTCACGAVPEGSDELTGGDDVGAVASTQQAVVTNLRQRAASAAQLRINGDLQEWVFACDTLGRLRHRVRYGDGTWGGWRNHGHSCSGPPTVAVYLDADGNEMPVAYYTSGFALMETGWTSASSSSTVNLSTYTGLGTVNTDPVVSYYNKSNGDVSVLIATFPDGELHSLDFYAGRWHKSFVLDWPGDDLEVFFSWRTQPGSYFLLSTGNVSRAYKRTDPASAYTEVGRYTGGGLAFGGRASNCRDTGCLTLWTTDGKLRWGYMSSQAPTTLVNTWMTLFSGPKIRAGGDPGQAYLVGGGSANGLPHDRLLAMHTFYDTFQGGRASHIPTSEPSLVTNVYAGSRYERDAFMAGGERTNRLMHLSVLGDDDHGIVVTDDLGLDVILSKQ